MQQKLKNNKPLVFSLYSSDNSEHARGCACETVVLLLMWKRVAVSLFSIFRPSNWHVAMAQLEKTYANRTGLLELYDKPGYLDTFPKNNAISFYRKGFVLLGLG